MKMLKLSPYHKIFYEEWKRNPTNLSSHIIFDQTISHSICLNRLENSLERFVKDYLLLNSHIVEDDPNNIYWVQNNFINKLDYLDFNCEKEKLLNYISYQFDLKKGPLYRFAIYQELDNTYRFIVVIHHILIDGASVNMLLSEISNYYNDSSYRAKYSIEEQLHNIVSDPGTPYC
jgi:NRPS condensation-like uncharacterized protein